MKLGFTGTRRGMTDAQKRAVADVLADFKRLDLEVHHGDCVGADEEFHDLAGRVNAIRIVHPPVDEKHRAKVMFADAWREPKTHFARNRDIVNETDRLLATPCEAVHQTSGGTWYTVDYAQKVGKSVMVVWPNGTCEVFRNGQVIGALSASGRADAGRTEGE